MADSWEVIDRNPETFKVCGERGETYQLHTSGRVWRRLSNGDWEMLSNNPATVDIYCADGYLYQMTSSGRVYRYTGVPVTGWEQIADNPVVSSLAAAGSALFALERKGRVWSYPGSGSVWTDVTSVGTGFNQLAGAESQRMGGRVGPAIVITPEIYAIEFITGKIAQYSKAGWATIASNQAVVALVGGQYQDGFSYEATVYALESGGIIQQYTGPAMTGWTKLDDDSRTEQIAAGGTGLYKRRRSGSVWAYSGTPMGWDQIAQDDISTRLIAASADAIYLLRASGELLKKTVD